MTSQLVLLLLIKVFQVPVVSSTDFGLSDSLLLSAQSAQPAQPTHRRTFSGPRIVQDIVEFATTSTSVEDNQDSDGDFPFVTDPRLNQRRETETQPYQSRLVDGLSLSLTLPQQRHDQDHATNAPPTRTLRSTGTTIAGLVLADRTVILGADTRATDDRMVADKYCSKIHPLTTTITITQQQQQQQQQQTTLANSTSSVPPIFACGAGTSGDLDAVTRQVRYSMKLQHLQEETIGNREPSQSPSSTAHSSNPTVHQVCKFLQDHLYEAGGSLGVNLIVGAAGGTLVAIHPHGSLEHVPYAALGSGGYAAMAILEERYRPTLSLQQAMKLVARAIKAGIDNDLGSGSQVDLCILHTDGTVQYLRAAVPEESSLSISSADFVDAVGSVNGFGNLPYQEQSRRTLRSNDSNGETDWDSVLGLK